MDGWREGSRGPEESEKVHGNLPTLCLLLREVPTTVGWFEVRKSGLGNLLWTWNHRRNGRSTVQYLFKTNKHFAPENLGTFKLMLDFSGCLVQVSSKYTLLKLTTKPEKWWLEDGACKMILSCPVCPGLFL